MDMLAGSSTMARLAARRAEADRLNQNRVARAAATPANPKRGFNDPLPLATWRDITWRGRVIPIRTHAWMVDGNIAVTGDFKEVPGVVQVIPSDKLTRECIRGYYRDAYEDETINPAVVIMRVHGTVYVVPAYEYSQSDCPVMLWQDREVLRTVEAYSDTGYASPDLEDTIRSVGYRAHQVAEQLAECDRDASIEDRAQCERDDLGTEVATLRSNLRTLLRELRRVINTPAVRIESPAICTALHQQVRDMRQQIGAARARIKALADNPYLATPGY